LKIHIQFIDIKDLTQKRKYTTINYEVREKGPYEDQNYAKLAL